EYGPIAVGASGLARGVLLISSKPGIDVQRRNRRTRRTERSCSAVSASSALIVVWLTRPSGSFDNLVGPQTPRADADASDAAIDHGAHRLQVRLESTRTDVVCVTVPPADDRALSTHFTCPGHDAMFLCFVPCHDIQRRNRRA